MSGPSVTTYPLPRLVKPRFSCGQLLTDQDLTALVDWSESKSGLGSYRHGWGVVCGLEVYGDGHDGQVSLGPGYAVDGCGRDVVVLGETVVSLDVCCKQERDVRAAAAPEETVEFAAQKMENIRAIDLVLQYAETGASPRATLGGVNCGGSTACEYSRMQQSSRVECRVGKIGHDPAAVREEMWESQYRKSIGVVQRYRQECSGAGSADIRHWLLHSIERNPLRSVCFVKDWISGEPHDGWDEGKAVEALFWLVQDSRNSFLQRGCPDCTADSGVPIARVWVRLPREGARKKCQIVAIDAHPPYRRPMEREHGWIASGGRINCAQVIWRRIGEAKKVLGSLGLRVEGTEPFSPPETAEELEKQLEEGKVMLDSDSHIRLQTLSTGAMGYRVIGIL